MEALTGAALPVVRLECSGDDCEGELVGFIDCYRCPEWHPVCSDHLGCDGQVSFFGDCAVLWSLVTVRLW